MNLMSRQEAVALGNYKYFTGEPCKHGHVAERYTRTCVCTECHKTANAKQLQRMNNALMGARGVQIITHPDDHVALRAYADLLNMQRGLRVVQPGTNGTPAPQPPAPPETAEQRDARLLRMWTNVHGETIARQVLEMERTRPTNGS